MNGKIKIVVIVVLALGLVASVFYLAPALAYMNDSTEQTQDRDMDRIRDRNCAFNCEQDQNQACVSQHLQRCIQNQTSLGPTNWQHEYEHQHRHQNMLSP